MKQMYKCKDPNNIAFSEGLIFVTAKGCVYYIDRNKVLKLKVSEMTRDTAVRYAFDNCIITGTEVEQLHVNNIRT